MTTIVKKEDLELKKYYRKIKLDIEEYVDKEEAEKLDLDKPIYGDEEGYFKVVDKQEDGYIVKFMNLENFRLRAVLEGNIDNEDFKIRKTFAKRIKNQDLDLDDMDNEYAEITLTRIIKELLEQYKSNGKKGIKLQKKKQEEDFDIDNFDNASEIQEKIDEYGDFINNSYFIGTKLRPVLISGTNEKKLYEIQDRRLKLQIILMRNINYQNNETIINFLRSGFSNTKPIPYKDYKNFEKILKSEGLLEKKPEKEKKITTERELFDYDKQELFDTYDFKWNPEFAKILI